MSKKKSTEIIAKPVQGEVASFIQQAIAQNLPVETMEKLFALREKVKAEAAKEAFVQALAQFQINCPVIKKTKKVMNKDGASVRYMFAPIDSIVEQIKKPLGDAGLSYRWETRQEGTKVTAICRVTHVLGHTESSEFTVEVDPEAYMTTPQKSASALTFAKRYSLTNALGISTGDEDTDATDVGKEKGAKSDKAKIMFLLKTLKISAKKKEEIEEVVKEKTQLELVEKNYPEIVTRLEVLVQESHEDKEIH